MSTSAPTHPFPLGTATRRFADPAPLPGTTLWHDQVVPNVRFSDATDSHVVRPTDFRHRRALVLGFVHDQCRDCAVWTQQAIDAVTGRSDAEIRVVAPRSGPRIRDGLLWLDREDARSRLLTDPDVPAVLLLDRYGAIQEAGIADDHRLPDADQVIATLDHLAMQCPECSV